MAMGLVLSKCAKTIIIITVIGTDRNIPSTPQIVPHKARENRITRGLRFNDLLMNRGSIMLPTMN